MLATCSVTALTAAENAMIDLPLGLVMDYNSVTIFHRLSFLEQSLTVLDCWRWCLGKYRARPLDYDVEGVQNDIAA